MSDQVGTHRSRQPSGDDFDELDQETRQIGNVVRYRHAANALAIGLQIQILNASTIDEINAAFASFARERSDALLDFLLRCMNLLSQSRHPDRVGECPLL
jgi:hypothetical protein